MKQDSAQISQEYHIASFVAQCRPEHRNKLTNFINQLEGLEVHATNPQGKLVFTCEADSQKAIAHTIDSIQHHPEILSLSPVYHQFLDAEQLAQEG